MTLHDWRNRPEPTQCRLQARVGSGTPKERELKWAPAKGRTPICRRQACHNRTRSFTPGRSDVRHGTTARSEMRCSPFCVLAPADRLSAGAGRHRHEAAPGTRTRPRAPPSGSQAAAAAAKAETLARAGTEGHFLRTAGGDKPASVPGWRPTHRQGRESSQPAAPAPGVGKGKVRAAAARKGSGAPSCLRSRKDGGAPPAGTPHLLLRRGAGAPPPPSAASPKARAEARLLFAPLRQLRSHHQAERPTHALPSAPRPRLPSRPPNPERACWGKQPPTNRLATSTSRRRRRRMSQ